MRATILSLFRPPLFENLLRHAEKVRETAQMFKNAFFCYVDGDCTQFEELHEKVNKLEHEADEIKRNIRGHLPRGIFMPVDKFPFLWYLREEDKVCDAVQDALHWLSFRSTLIPDEIMGDFLKLVDQAVKVIEELVPLVDEARGYFRSYSEQRRLKVKERINIIRRMEHESDQIERKLMSQVFIYVMDPIASFHLIRLIQIIGEISNHAENAGDMMRAMIAR
jgi:predicted phosphate transport protein (TIGR00153 family)